MAEYHCTLAKKYDPGKHDVLGWMMSEKLDGVRALWCPERQGFFSRSNKPLHAPALWLDMMRNVITPLDGEFFMGRGRFQDTVSAVRKKSPTFEQFKGVKYVVFDAITPGQFSERLLKAHAAVHPLPRELVFVLRHHVITSQDQAAVLYADVLSNGGEGVMFRNPQSGYEKKRTGNLLKWKDEIDGTATIIGIEPGKGKHEGRMGALVCRDHETGVVFNVGTGFTDEQREWWNRIDGDVVNSRLDIRWRAMERTRDNIPRHPVFVCCHEGD
jgi:DNA ligase-1